MSAKQFVHFQNFWRQTTALRPAKAKPEAAGDPRVPAAKAALRACLPRGGGRAARI